ncbi:trigger factor [Candidatus Gracilibacteria bacterium GN02-872]|nr:trigger factor [Candidatus Gracilibacteria bacterium GN02-872]
MKIERKNLENSIVELVVEEKTENLAKYRKEVLKDVEKNATIKGFRKGAKIPEEVIVREFGEERLASMTLEKAIDNIYRNALRQEKIIPIGQGEITEIISENPLKIRIHIEVLPEVEIADTYKNISLKKKKTKVTEQEVENALNDIQTRFTNFTEADEALVMGDRATISTKGFDKEGKNLDNTNMEQYPIVLGSKMLVEGFEEGLVGHKKGDKFKLEINFPKDYHNVDFAGKETVFEVKIDKVEKATKPEFTEEFIEQLRGKKLDLDGFKKLIKEEITETKEANLRMEEELELIEELLKHTKVQIGDKLLAEQTNRVFEEIKQNMAQNGIRMVDYLESLKLTEEDYKEQHVKENALKRLHGELILAKLATLEKVELTDEEVKSETDKIIARFGNEDVIKRLKELYVPGNRYYEELKQRMIYRKIIDSFYDKK